MEGNGGGPEKRDVKGEDGSEVQPKPQIDQCPKPTPASCWDLTIHVKTPVID